MDSELARLYGETQELCCGTAPVIPLPLLLGNWQKYLIIGIAILAAAGMVWIHGYGKGSSRLFEYQAKQAQEATRIAGVRQVVTEKVITKYVKTKGDTQTVTQTIEKEVERYAGQNSGTCLDGAFRRLHDQSALNVSQPPRLADGESGAPQAAIVLSTVTQNYAKHHQCADRLDALQDWLRGQIAVQ